MVHGLGIGGLETGLVNLVRGLPRDRYRHLVLCLRELGPNAPRLEAAGARVHLAAGPQGRDRFAALRLRRHLRSYRPHVVHTRNYGALDGVLAARLALVPRVLHGEHGWDTPDMQGTSQRRARIRGLLSPLVTRYVTVSDHMNAWLRTHRGFFGDKVVTIHNGVDVQRFERLAPPASRPNRLVFGTVGRLAPVKDQASLIAAFAVVAAGRPELQLVLYGEGPLGDELRRQAAETGLGDRIIFRGFQQDPATIYSDMDVFVLPSLNEGISNTILESMAAARPVVATEVGGNPELVAAGATGELVPAGDPDALAAAMRRYADDPLLAVRHGRAGRERAAARFSLDRMVAAYADLYGSLAAGLRPRCPRGP